MGHTSPKQVLQTRGIYFIPKIIPLLILYVLKPEPPASQRRVSDRRPAGAGLPAAMLPPPGPKSLQSPPAGVSAMHPFRSLRSPKSECPGPCSRGLASWNENSGRASQDLGPEKGTRGPPGAVAPQLPCIVNRHAAGWPTAGASPHPRTAAFWAEPTVPSSHPHVSSRGSVAQGHGYF